MEEDIFNAFFFDLWEAFLKKAVCPDMGGKTVQFLYQKEFTAKLQEMAARVLIQDLHEKKDAGLLSGANTKEEYESYVGWFLTGADNWDRLKKAYPVLFRYMDRFVSREAENASQMLEEIYAERERVNAFFFPECPFRNPIAVESGMSDSHCGGKRVFFLHLDNGKKLVYKPRSLMLDTQFMRFSLEISKNIGLSLYPYRILDCGEHGWTEYVEQLPCRTEEEAKRYFRRIGIWLCISQCCASSDMHFENLIAHGEYPVIIDLETVVNPEDVNWREQALSRRTVLQSGFLPVAVWDKRGEGINVSAVNGGNEGTFFMEEMPCIIHGGTSDIQISYQRPAIKGGKNRAYLKKTELDTAMYVEEIKAGFRAGYRYIMKNKEMVKRLVEGFAGCRRRVLLRNTQAYYMVLNLSRYPQFYKSEQAYASAFSHLYRQSPGSEKEKWVCVQEQEQLLQGDIPYFYRKIGEDRLYAGNGSFFQDEQEKTITSIQDRIDAFCTQDEMRQTEWIQMGCAYRIPACVLKKQTECLDVEQEKILCAETVEKIARRIERLAVISANQRDIGWYQMTFPHEEQMCVHIDKTGMYLYDGLAGILVFLEACHRWRPGPQIGGLISVLREKLFSYTQRLEDSPRERAGLSTGIFHGEGSIAYAYLLLYRNTGEELYRQYALRHGRILGTLLEGDKLHDLLGGNAGALIILLKLYEASGEEEFLEMAKQAGNHLLTHAASGQGMLWWENEQSPRPLGGISHGTCGIMLAFAKLLEQTGDLRLVPVLRQIQAYEDSLYVPEIRDWRDLRADTWEKQTQKSHCSWCHGRGGILYGRSQIEDILEARQIPVEEHAWNEKVQWNDSLRNEFCLCHGNIGNAVMLSGIDRDGAKEMGERLWQEVLFQIEQYREMPEELFIPREWHNMGFMIGLSGIGYYLLRRLIPLEDVLKL